MDLKQLVNDVGALNEAFDVLDEELQVLRKLIYKNTSQHRRAKYFQYLVQVKRMHRLLKKEELKEVVVKIQKVARMLQIKDGMHHVAWKNLNSDIKMDLDGVLRQIVAIVQTCVEAMEAEKKTYQALGTQFAMTFFVPFCVVVNSLLGRLYVLKQTILIRFIQAHHCLILAYLAQVAHANPLRAGTTAIQLSGYEIPRHVLVYCDSTGLSNER
ncbi:hypothetical protein THRCLA_05594 [Thraustotheca clavata]|uniref:Nucleolus and neural progenitor protein-like N-terminal domain-containing protein n=1 Tax=Thraustotheca clavata TaxID=74557 RepID=A0A1V9ZVF1_9STRA|nr:hypothetical protein THRCLA_05594 [Thraustotheca clavata]